MVALTNYESEFPADAVWIKVVRHLASQRSPTSSINLCYFGVTSTSTPEGRAEEDAAVEGASTRHNNFLRATGLEEEAFELFPWRRNDANAFRTDDGEAFLISIATEFFALNSSRGGFIPRFVTDDGDQDLVAAVNTFKMAPTHPAPSTLLASVSTLFDNAQNDFLRRQGRSEGMVHQTRRLSIPRSARVDERIKPLTFQEFKRQSTPVEVLEDGTTPLYWVQKDTTRDDVLGRTLYYGQNPGPGPAFGRRLWDVALVSIDTFTPFIDLWAVVLRHWLILVAVIWLVRCLVVIRPRVLLIDSNKVRLPSSSF
jgi:hypothetical protein